MLAIVAPPNPVVVFDVSLLLASHPYSILPIEAPAPVLSSSLVSRLSPSYPKVRVLPAP